MLGDLLVFSRKGGGHVGIYVGETGAFYHVFGANQGDQVNIRMIPKARCIAVRRPAWKIAQPDNVRVIKLTRGGVVSISEA
jgi:cell wall-associated NlpC family hydrolase